jgi:hypothetical protein
MVLMLVLMLLVKRRNGKNSHHKKNHVTATNKGYPIGAAAHKTQANT